MVAMVVGDEEGGGRRQAPSGFCLSALRVSIVSKLRTATEVGKSAGWLGRSEDASPGAEVSVREDAIADLGRWRWVPPAGDSGGTYWTVRRNGEGIEKRRALCCALRSALSPGGGPHSSTRRFINFHSRSPAVEARAHLTGPG